ncbi:MAG: DUF2293 domain-containing protein [Nibricoccus sp.]
MPDTREVRLCQKTRHVISAEGAVLAVPADWELLPPGDAALSRRLKEAGPTWTVIEIKGRKRFSHGIWAPATTIAALRAERQHEQADPAYQKKLAASRLRRAREEQTYATDFRAAVLAFLHFHPTYAREADQLATLIADHATPVGSGTVARTERIPIEQRAEAATIAWLRHQTTGYDTMTIARVKGLRREIRQQLAQRSRDLLHRYRQGQAVDPANCALAEVLKKAATSIPPSPPAQTLLF